MNKNSKRKNIILVSDTKNWGGWKRAQMIRRFCKDEFNIEIMDAEEYNDFQRRTSKNKFNLNDVSDFVATPAHIRGNDPEFLDVDEFAGWLNRTKIKDTRIDLIYFLFHTMLIKKSVKRVLATRNQKVITMVTVFPTLRPIFGEKKEAKVRFLEQANRCSAILANNKKSLNDLKKIYKGKTYLAPRGVNPDIFRPLNDGFKKKEVFTVAFCGKPNPEKGLESIIRPACRKAGVELITNERNFENALPEGQMNVFYNNADAYIVASTMDGTPNTALEAASCGKAILSNEIGNMPEFIKDGENGFLVDLNIRAYVEKLKWMKDNQKKVYQMGMKAREEIKAKWTWQIIINNNEKRIFRDIIYGM